MEERRRADEKLFKLNRALRAISECNQALIHATDEAALLNRVCRLLTDVSGYCLAWVGLAEQDEAKTLRPVAQAGFEEGYLETLQITWADTEGGRGPAGAAIRTGQPCAAQRHSNKSRLSFRGGLEALKCCYASSLVLPLKTGDRVLGALNIYSVKPDGFDAEETKLLADLADDLTYGIAALRISAKQKQAETALRESEERLRLLGDNLPDSYVYQLTREADGTARFLYLSAGVEKLHGVKVDDVLRDASLLRRQIAREQVPVLQAAEECQPPEPDGLHDGIAHALRRWTVAMDAGVLPPQAFIRRAGRVGRRGHGHHRTEAGRGGKSGGRSTARRERTAVPRACGARQQHHSALDFRGHHHLP